jgi:hypothetical protein
MQYCNECGQRIDDDWRNEDELATDNNVVTKSGKDNNVLTIGDKIREDKLIKTEFYRKKKGVFYDVSSKL